MRRPLLPGRPGQRPRAMLGLTLLELLIGLSILAVLGALALPTMAARMEHERLHRAAQTLAGDIAEARFLAAARNLPMHVSGQAGSDSTAAWCWSVSASPDCACAGAAGAPACRIHAVAAGDHRGVRMLQAPSLQLDVIGRAQVAVAATFESAHGERLRVEVSLQGRPRICAAAGYWPRLPGCQ